MAFPTRRFASPTRRLVGALMLGAGLLCGCGGPSGHPLGRAGAPPPSIGGSRTAVPTSTTSTTACSDTSVVDSWPLPRRAAFVLVAPVLDFDMTTARVAADAGAGGVLFLGGRPAPATLGAQLRSAFGPGPGPAPLAMADEEGGGIQRLSGPVLSMPWPRTMAATMTAAKVESLTAQAGGQMKSLGVTVDLAPVADLDARPGPSSTNPDGQRSFSADPAVASRYTVAYMDGLENAGIIPVVKHFPGLGGSTDNTDYGPAATLPVTQLRSGGLVPFQSAIAAGAPAVMVSNAYVPGLTNLPSSLSSQVVSGMLRGDLGFRGLVLTDSLSAGAIRSAGYDLAHATVAAVAAGADMVLFGSTLTPADVAMLTPSNVRATLAQLTAALTAAVGIGSLPESRLDDAVLAVLEASHADLCAT